MAATKPSLPERILLVASEYPPATGGLQTMARVLVRELSRHHEVHLVLEDGEGPAPPEGEASVSRVDFRLRRAKRRRGELRDEILDLAGRRRADLVHFMNAGFAVLLGERWNGAGPPAVVHVAGKDLTRPWIRLGFTREKSLREIPRGLNAAAAVIAISEFTRRAIARAGVTRVVDLIPPGVDPVAEPDAAARARVPAGRPLVLCVARLERRKGHHVLIEAFARARRALPGAHLVITSDGPEREALRALARGLGQEDRIHFTGRIDAAELAALYHAADLFVLAPIVVSEGRGDDFEGFGIVYSEAASAGVPSIASDSGGACEAVRDGETGIVVPAGDVEALASALRTLATDADLRARLGTRAKERFLAHGTSGAMASRVREVYARIV